MKKIQVKEDRIDSDIFSKIRKADALSVLRFVSLASFSLLFCFSGASKAQDVLTEVGELPGQNLSRKTWEFEASATSYKSVAEYTDWVGLLGAGVSYNRIKDYNFKAELDYAFQYDSEVTQTEATRYGVQDLELTATYKDLVDGPIHTLRPVAKWYLPTSEVSQNATLYSTVGAGVSYSQIGRFFNFGTSHLLLASAFQYETTDAVGSDYNSPLGMSNGVNISRSFGKFSLVGSYSVTTYYNYASNFVNIQTFLSSASWRINPDLSITGYYRWRDDVYSYLSAFDDDTSITGLSLTYTM